MKKLNSKLEQVNASLINQIINIIEHWGLIAIYETRQEMNRKTDELFPDLEKKLDIIAWGLKSFRDSSKGRMIEDKVKHGLKVRIIAPHPDSKFVAQREHDEKEIPGQIRKTIVHLGEWVEHLKKAAQNESDVKIRYYESLPEDFFFRMDDHVFIGPYRYGISSQQTISYEFKGPSNGFRNYVDYFDRIWGDDSFCK